MSGRTTESIEIEHPFFAIFRRLREFHFGKCEGEHHTISRSYGGKGHFACALHISIAQDRPVEVEIVEVGEGISVAHHHLRGVLLRIYARETEFHELVCSFHLLEFCTLLTSTWKNTITHEVSLVRSWIVIAGVQTIDALFHLLGVVDALIHPVPHGSTDARVARFDGIPVSSEISHRITHGVRIFADEHRLIHVVGVFAHPVHVGIHLGIHIREAFSTKRTVDARAFVVNRARVVEFNGVVVAISKVFTISSFISQAPHNDRRVVEVAFHQSVNAINEGGYPTFEVGDALVSVVFEVGFVAGVQTIVVVHRIHARIVGIVRGANGVDVVLLHQQDVAEHRFVRHSATEFRIGVLTVYSLQ